MPTLPACGRHDLRDREWRVLEPLLPRGKKPGRPPKWPKRQLIDGIRWRVRTGAPWRDVPPRYGPWQSVYGLFRRWQRDGTWAAIVTALQALADAAGRITWDVSVDSATARAHQHAAGARRNSLLQKEPPGGTGPAEPGRSRARPVPRRAHDQVPPGLRAAAKAPRDPRHRGPARRQPAVHPGSGVHPRPPPARRPSEDPAGPRPRGQGVRVPREPEVPAAPRDPLHHPRAEGPDRGPEEKRQVRRPALRIR